MGRNVFMALAAASLVYASAPETLWTRTYGGVNDDVGRSMQLTADGGCIIAGYTRSFGAGGSDVWLLKVDAQGDTEWTRTYGGALDDEAYSVNLTFDGGCIVVGATSSYGAGGSDVWLLKVAASGDTEWTRTCGGNWDDFGYSVRQVADSGYVIAGEARDDGWLVKCDALGDTVWTRRPRNAISAECVRQAPNGDLLLTGENSIADGYHMRTDSTGDELWTRGVGMSYVNGVALRPDEGSVVVGFTWVAPPPEKGLQLDAFDSIGGNLWHRAYVPPYPYRGEALLGSSVERAGDGYIAVGRCTHGVCDIYLVRVDLDGDSLWTKVIGGDSEDIGYSCQQTADSGFLVVGTTRSFGAGGADVWLIRLEPEVIGIEERQPTVYGSLPAATIVRGILLLSSSLLTTHYSLLTPDGRKVLDLAPGPNDVRGLAPGVYLVREQSVSSSQHSGPSAVGRAPSAVSVRKVVIAR